MSTNSTVQKDNSVMPFVQIHFTEQCSTVQFIMHVTGKGLDTITVNI